MPKLEDSTIVVHLNLQVPTGLKRLPNIERSIAEMTSAETRRVRASKRILDSPLIARGRTLVSALRAAHYEITLPWQQDGRRLLPLRFHTRHTELISRAQDELARLRSEVRSEYTNLIEHDQATLGTLFNPGDYPSAEKLAARFRIECQSEPLTDTRDLRIALPSEEIDKLRLQIEQQRSIALAEATESLWRQLEESIGRLTESLGDPRARLYSATLRNLLDLCSRLDGLNVAGDRQLAEMQKKLLADFSELDLEAARKQPGVRQSAAAAARVHLDAISRRTAALDFDEFATAA
ncbi:MAG: hypothetical protein K8F56_17505 [Rhodocyclaceae bacterium]|nr:hypothetical protein [Rhodocyclaceae bacterium]